MYRRVNKQNSRLRGTENSRGYQEKTLSGAACGSQASRRICQVSQMAGKGFQDMSL